jgi:hypothetical protein
MTKRKIKVTMTKIKRSKISFGRIGSRCVCPVCNCEVEAWARAQILTSYGISAQMLEDLLKSGSIHIIFSRGVDFICLDSIAGLGLQEVKAAGYR